MKTLYVFIDISGDYRFDVKRDKYLVFTSLICTNISVGTDDLHNLKYELLASDQDIYRFHCSTDHLSVRNQVFNLICKMTHFRLDSIIVEKRKTYKALSKNIGRLYSIMIGYLLKYPFDARGMNALQFDKVIVILDRESGKETEKRAKLHGTKEFLKNTLINKQYALYMHPSEAHPYLQIVDYCGWAIYRKWQTGDTKYYDKIKPLIKGELDITRLGNQYYY